jgi:hypothetical protein
VFLFFDDQERGNNQYEVRYRTLSNPDVAWEPPELKELSPRGFATGIVGSYAPAGLGYSPPCIAAKVLNDRIYVFYHDEEFIYYRAYDGAEWTPRRKVSEDRYHPSFALCSATRNGEPVIVFAGVPHADSPHLHVKIVSGSGEVTGHGSIYLDWVQNNNRFGIGHGALLGEARSNVIQVFGNNSGSRTDLRRTTYDLDDLTSAGPWHDTGLSARPHRWSHCDVVRVVVPSEASSADPREYLVVFHTRDAFDTAVLVAPHGGMAAYPSPRP